MKQNYLIITPFFPDNNSFVGSYVYDQVKAIKKEGTYNPIVVRLKTIYDDFQGAYEFEGVQCIEFKVFDFPSFIFPTLFHRINNFRFRRFLKLNDINDFSLCHAHVTYPAGYLAVALKPHFACKVIVQHHGLDVMQLDLGKTLMGSIKRLQNNYLTKRGQNVLNQVDLNVGVSQLVLDQFTKQKINLSGKTTVLYNGVDYSKFYPVKKKKKSYSSNLFIIGCIGNFWPLKDQITLIKAIEELVRIDEKEIMVKFLGEGVELEKCKEYIKDKRISKYFSFQSSIPHNDLNNFYNSIDLFALPSYYEALGCVYLESYAAGKPFIAVYGQGIEELMSKDVRNSYLIKKGDYKDLSKKITQCKNKELPNLTINRSLDIGILVDEFLEQVKAL